MAREPRKKKSPSQAEKVIREYSTAKSVTERLPDDFEDAAVDITVLFSDLVGSTAFKQTHSPIQGVRRVHHHNSVVCSHVVAFEGTIVKNLGDGIMAVFKGEDQAANAIGAGLAIIDQFARDDASEGSGQEDTAKIQTKIGVHRGKSWPFRYRESEADDPLGINVDIAARLIDLADPQQLVCTLSTLTAAKQCGRWNKVLAHEESAVCERYIKGVESHIDVQALCPSACGKPGEVRWHGHERVVPKRVVDRLSIARKHKRSSEWSAAFSAYKEVLDGFVEHGNQPVEGDGANFEANYQLAQIILQDVLTKAFLSQHGIEDETLYAFKRLCVAKQTRPDYSRLWLALGWIRFVWWHEKREVEIKRAVEGPEQHRIRAIENTEKALTDALARSDPDGEALAKAQLAHILWRTSPDKLQRASRLIVEAADVFDNEVAKHKSQVHVTHALILIAQEGAADKDIETLLAKAQEADPSNPAVDEARAQLKRKRMQATCKAGH